MSDRPTHPASWTADALQQACSVRRLRRSGPGGQHRNKVETAIALQHTTTGVEAEANERRSQADNLRVALFRLRVNLALAIRMPFDVEGPPSELWQSRCPRGRIAVNPAHDDFPTLLAEVLDCVRTHEFDLRSAGEPLKCTPSQLIKFLKLEPRALALVNNERTIRSLHPLR